MLSSEDRRKLESIERRLRQDDPGLARALAAGPDGAPRRSRTAELVVAGVVTALLSLLLLGPGVLIVGMVLLLVGLTFNGYRSTGG
jgi:hypothetical protein